MAINFSTLTGAKTVTGSIANFVNRGDLPTTNILLEAEALIYERLRVREMQSRETAFTFAEGDQDTALPSGFLDPISFRPYEYAEPLPFVHEEGLNEARDASGVLNSGTPSRWTIIGEQALVDVLPDADFIGVLAYYKQPTALSGSNETNFLTVRYPSLVRYACMAKAYEFMKDAQSATTYMALTQDAIEKANASNELYRRNQYVPA